MYFIYRRLLSLSQTCSSIIGSPTLTNQWSLTLSRTKMRYHFPRPNEYKRIKKHGWFTRMSTPAGRRILMRRILRGRHILSH
ncbi:39S ribosomal protein L34, mitochondrial [Dufourea novaeangliae]|uniref:Large ribosomal subunit protein bL34m n=1 Tax=Dufourea novaeangliae TaxID=178035 RepID=A0A154PGM5_DUFNO|nr:39S ribosomal protein L34, mitochondrial [Dufourea novaeangliae]